MRGKYSPCWPVNVDATRIFHGISYVPFRRTPWNVCFNSGGKSGLMAPLVDWARYAASFGLRGLMLRGSRRSQEYDARNDQPLAYRRLAVASNAQYLSSPSLESVFVVRRMTWPNVGYERGTDHTVTVPSSAVPATLSRPGSTLVRTSVNDSYGCARSSSLLPPQSSLRTTLRRTVRSLLRPRSTPPVYSSIPCALRLGSSRRSPRPPDTDCRSASLGT